MSLRLLFWILMLAWLVFGLMGVKWSGTDWYRPLANTGFLFVLFAILGWKTFGAPVSKD